MLPKLQVLEAFISTTQREVSAVEDRTRFLSLRPRRPAKDLTGDRMSTHS